MTDHSLVDANGSVLKTFATEEGKHYRVHTQDIGQVMDHVKMHRELNEGRRDSAHLCTIPEGVLLDWLRKHGFTFRDFMTNAGGNQREGIPGGPGVKDQFLKFFLGRDFSKLHNQHVTTKRSDSGFHFQG